MLYVIFISLILSGCSIFQNNSQAEKKPVYTPPYEFVRVKGQDLVVGSNETKIILKGICLGNEVWANPSNPPYNHHAEIDYQRIKNMNMNVVRFYLNYRIFEEDSQPYVYKASGWQWLDQNIAWAKKYGIYIIFNMHVPQGGFQSLGTGNALWDNVENQRRLKALWRAIADRYKNEPTVIGYDLLNEPNTSKSKDQWINLAKELVKEIRKVDSNHIVIVERLNAVANNWSAGSNMNFFLVDDFNVMYTFHFYSPIEYTHQLTMWTGFSNQDGGAYPDSNRIQVPDDIEWNEEIPNPRITNGSVDWTNIGGIKFKPKADSIVAKPAFKANFNSGITFFDYYVVEEYDNNTNLIKSITNDIESVDGLSYWSQNGSGIWGITSSQKKTGNYSLYISNTTHWANVGNNKLFLTIKPGYLYSIKGYLKTINANGENFFTLDFFKSRSGQKPTFRDINYISNEMAKYLDWGKKNNVPLYCGEFGVFIECMTNQSKGGDKWIKDVVKVLKDSGIHFTYHSYHEVGSFGIYTNAGSLPTESGGIQHIINALKEAYDF
ncbi:MAG: glycoside hydrolase family 5 protein [Brevinematales bacterium]|nr:glycoside hydrolase family 5 protein [Brevinematales bacterium]